MNKLNKTITQKFYKDPNGFTLIENWWRTNLKKGFKPTTKDLLVYAILRGKDFKKGFTPVTDENKINCNGRYPNDTLVFIVSKFRFIGIPEYFEEFLVDNAMDLIDDCLLSTAYEYRTSEYGYRSLVNV